MQPTLITTSAAYISTTHPAMEMQRGVRQKRFMFV